MQDAVKGFFFGYDRNSPTYLVCCPETGKVYRHRVVKFVSNLERKSESELEHVQTKKNDVSVHKPVQTEECFDTDDLLFKQKDDERAKGSKDKKEAEIVQGRSECMSENREPSTERRYHTRERRPPVHLADCKTNFDNDDDQVMTNTDYCYKLVTFPQSYSNAMKPPDSVLWKEAMEEEMKSLNENETFFLTTLPEGRTAVGVGGRGGEGGMGVHS